MSPCLGAARTGGGKGGCVAFEAFIQSEESGRGMAAQVEFESKM